MCIVLAYEIYNGRTRKRDRRIIIVRFARAHRRSGNRRLAVYIKTEFAVCDRHIADVRFVRPISVVSTSNDAKRLRVIGALDYDLFLIALGNDRPIEQIDIYDVARSLFRFFIYFSDVFAN